jgi:hypothetical protein
MGWDRGRYYTRSRKIGGRVIREYVGHGPAGELAARLDALARARRLAEVRAAAEADRERRGELDALDAQARELVRLTDVPARAALAAAGFRQHARGAWRRRTVPRATKRPAAAAVPATKREREALLRRAERGDESALPAVWELMRRNPALVTRYGGNLAVQLVLSVAGQLAGSDQARQAALLQAVSRLKAELAGPTPTPAELLLAERAAVCWLQMHYYDLVLAQNEDKLSARQAEYQQRLAERAQRRYLAALKMLAVVRRLALPVLQVNVADKQVNVAG